MNLINNFFKLFKKNQKEEISISTELSRIYLDDETFIRNFYHIQYGPWEQYDIVMNTPGYG